MCVLDNSQLNGNTRNRRRTSNWVNDGSVSSSESDSSASSFSNYVSSTAVKDTNVVSDRPSSSLPTATGANQRRRLSKVLNSFRPAASTQTVARALVRKSRQNKRRVSTTTGLVPYRPIVVADDMPLARTVEISALTLPQNAVDISTITAAVFERGAAEADDDGTCCVSSTEHLRSAIRRHFGAAGRLKAGARCRITARRYTTDHRVEYLIQWDNGIVI